jgi:tetratricopeptide (TPR) repeat protein
MRFIRWIAARFASPKSHVPAGGPYVLAQTAHAELRSQQYDRARVLLLQAIGSRAEMDDPVLIDYLLGALASTWLLTDRYEDAIAFFTAHIANYPQDSEAYHGRGAALWYLGRLQQAIPDYTRALELKPDTFLTLSGRGQLLAEVGEPARAMEDLDPVLRLLKTTNSTDPELIAWHTDVEAFARNGRAFALSGLGDFAAAMSEFDRSIALCPDNAWVYHNRAQAYEHLGDLNRARADYERSLSKTGPALSLPRKEHAQTRLSSLSNHS